MFVESYRKSGSHSTRSGISLAELEAAYLQMAQDEEHEAEALEWVEAMYLDVAEE